MTYIQIRRDWDRKREQFAICFSLSQDHCASNPCFDNSGEADPVQCVSNTSTGWTCVCPGTRTGLLCENLIVTGIVCRLFHERKFTFTPWLESVFKVHGNYLGRRFDICCFLASLAFLIACMMQKLSWLQMPQLTAEPARMSWRGKPLLGNQPLTGMTITH